MVNCRVDRVCAEQGTDFFMLNSSSVRGDIFFPLFSLSSNYIALSTIISSYNFAFCRSRLKEATSLTHTFVFRRRHRCAVQIWVLGRRRSSAQVDGGGIAHFYTYDIHTCMYVLASYALWRIEHLLARVPSLLCMTLFAGGTFSRPDCVV